MNLLILLFIVAILNILLTSYLIFKPKNENYQEENPINKFKESLEKGYSEFKEYTEQTNAP